MYRDHIKTTGPHGHPQFYIPRSDIEFDPRAKFVEHVCAVLIESRFGPGRTSNLIINLTDRPGVEPVFFDLSDNGPNGRLTPCYTLSPQGRAGYQVIEAAFRRAEEIELSAAESNADDLTHPPNNVPPNQG